MARFRNQDSEPFQRKVLENYHAGVLLLGKKWYNAAASRFYYSFILLALRNAAMYGDEIKEDCYCIHGQDKIDKSKIKNNSRGLKIRAYIDFAQGMNRAEAARVKADYFPTLLNDSDFSDILPKLKHVLVEEGVLNE
jgi:hypothetical protein